MDRKIIIAILLCFLAAGSICGQETGRVDTLEAAVKIASRPVAAETGMYALPPVRIFKTVSPLGTGDVVKFAQTLPGITTGAEGSSTVYARGGNIGNNVFTLDGTPIYRPTHLLGFTTAFSPDLTGDTELYLGGFTSDEGNLTASHIKMTSRTADWNRAEGKASLSNFFVDANVSVPIVRERLTFTGSARYSILPLEYRAVKDWLKRSQSVFDTLTTSTYDLYGKLDFKINERGRVSLSAFRSYDSFGYVKGPAANTVGWDNTIASLNFNYALSERTRIEVRASYNDNGGSQLQDWKLEDERTLLEMRSRMREVYALAEMHTRFTEGLELQYGLSSRSGWFNVKNNVSSVAASNWQRSVITSANVQLTWSGLKHMVRAGARMNVYHLVGDPSENKIFYMPEGSLMARFKVVRDFGVEMTVDYVSQFYHTLEGVPMGWSVDLIVPAGKTVRPETALQGYAGLCYDRGIHHVKLGGYAKRMYGLVYYPDATTLFSTSLTAWKSNVESGTGTSYGGEFFYEVNGRRFNGTLAYTLSKTDRLFRNVNYGKPFPAKFDRRHIINATASYTIIDKGHINLDFITSFTLQSGHWETMQDGYLPVWGVIDQSVRKAPLISAVNNYQMPTYIRWDNSVRMEIQGSRVSHTVNLGLYNTLNRHNPSMVFYNYELRRWQTVSLIPIMPSLYYSIAF